MDDQFKRLLLFMALSMAVLYLYGILNPPAKPTSEPQQEQQVAREESAPSGKPTQLSESSKDENWKTPERLAEPEKIEEQPGREITLETDTFRVVFNTKGAHPVRWQIIDPAFAKASQNDVEALEKEGGTNLKAGDYMPIDLIPDYENLPKDRDYPLMVVLKETAGNYMESLNRRNYEVEGPVNVDGGKRITFVSPITREGLRMKKIFTFPEKGYLVNLRLELENVQNGNAQNLNFSEPGQPGLGLIWGPGIGGAKYTDRIDNGLYFVAAFDGEDIEHERFGNWEDAAEGKTLEENFTGDLRWGLVESRFYMAALAPKGLNAPVVRGLVKRADVPRSKEAQDHMAHPITAEVYTGDFRLTPGDKHVVEFQMFVGPKKRKLLTAVDEQEDLGLHNIMFHNVWWIIRVLALFMLGILNWIYGLTHNYGVAIILLTIVMRLLTQPLTHIGMKSQARVMAEQQRIKPLIDSINEKYKDDPQKRNAEIWKTYREHNINPLGMMKGCVWMLIQLPIFIALYRLLTYAIDLRGEHFLWIQDLTAPDALFTLPFSLPFLGNKFNILPIMMGASQVLAQRLQTTNLQDPNQKMMATLMPVMFTFILYNFAAGLSLYWFVSNLWQITFQILVNRKIKEEAEKKAHAKFEAKQAAGPPPNLRKDESKTPGWREKMMGYLEQKAKEAEKRKKK